MYSGGEPRLEATARQMERCVSSVASDLGCVDILKELALCHGGNHTHLAQEAETLSEPGGR